MEYFFFPLSDEQLRIAANLELAYAPWVEAVRAWDALPNSLYWVTKNGRDYLSIKNAAYPNGTTLGVRSAETEAQFAQYYTERQALEQNLALTEKRLAEVLAQYRALKLPLASVLPGRILRELDIAQLLGQDLMLVGTNAFAAYELHARQRFLRGVGETEDFDLGWCRGSAISLSSARSRPIGSPLLSVLRKMDSTYRVNPRKPYQARNAAGYEVELLAAPSAQAFLSADEVFSPMASLPEQEWLLKGRALFHVAGTRDGKAAPLFVPDPRWMALHKLWLADKPERRQSQPLKADKDRLQGEILLDAVAQFMPDYPLDLDFVLALPEELLGHFNAWARSRQFVPGSAPTGSLR